MKQEYYTLSHQASNCDIWVSTMSASKKYIENLRVKLTEAGRKVKSIGTRRFDNHFVYKPWGPGSEYTTFDHNSFTSLGEAYTCRQESNGNYYCVAGSETHTEVQEAYKKATAKESKEINNYYSQPWV